MIVDLGLIALIVGYGLVGLRQGLVVGMLSTAGFLTGALLAMLIAPKATSGMDPGVAKAVIVLVALLLGAWAGQLLGGMLGVRLRGALHRSPARVVDQALGLVASTVTVSLVMWFLAGAITSSPLAGLTRGVEQSRVLAGIDRLVPDEWSTLAQGMRAGLSDNTFPRVFSGLGVGSVAPAQPPDPMVANSAGARAALRSTVKITGEASSCNRQFEGSGVVVAAGRVITNAHVVAGVERPLVQPGGVGRRYRATVVAFDPRRDVAVLSVPGLPSPAIRRGEAIRSGDQGVVAGFPNNGPFRAVAARVRRVIDAQGDDIYGASGARREVYELYAAVEPGNSGGPLVDESGAMVGLIFARSQTDRDTGYATTLAEIDPVLVQGLRSEASVEDTRCAG